MFLVRIGGDVVVVPCSHHVLCAEAFRQRFKNTGGGYQNHCFFWFVLCAVCILVPVLPHGMLTSVCYIQQEVHGP